MSHAPAHHNHPVEHPEDQGPRRPCPLLAVALAAQILDVLDVLDVSVVNTGLPTMRRSTWTLMVGAGVHRGPAYGRLGRNLHSHDRRGAGRPSRPPLVPPQPGCRTGSGASRCWYSAQSTICTAAPAASCPRQWAWCLRAMPSRSRWEPKAGCAASRRA